MSWFKNIDIQSESIPVSKSSSAFFKTPVLYRESGELEEIKKTIGDLPDGGSVFFVTRGAWSNLRLLEHLLDIAGQAEVYFSTWSISEEAIRKLSNWLDSGTITRLAAVLDQGIRNRKPELYQQLIVAFKELKFSKCHAKVCVVIGKDRVFTIVGSANFTRNPRIEAGIIVTDAAVALANINWILEELYNE